MSPWHILQRRSSRHGACNVYWKILWGSTLNFKMLKPKGGIVSSNTSDFLIAKLYDICQYVSSQLSYVFQIESNKFQSWTEFQNYYNFWESWKKKSQIISWRNQKWRWLFRPYLTDSNQMLFRLWDRISFQDLNKLEHA